ncbi:alpha/beta hydrolase [Aliidiomarina minuta]|uniref:Alpha/beta hydrolase n=1 Tax=Aliidiomarina minuta TaxID=880057 RepID=A0A432W8V4_9GAMM|nr:alpha/beta hydrolase [Aliidiomarina minuta]RUO26512.1 alpha/beta hydrolase [Aliidiomarina minuta]
MRVPFLQARYFRPLLIATTSAFLLSACSGTSLLNSVVPSGSYNVNDAIVYGEHNRQRMDIYLPDEKPHKQQVMVFIYGGSWEQGDKSDFEFIGQAFARLGYITLIPNYRIYPEVEFPDFINDVAMALSTLPQHMPGGCPSGHEIIIMGHSAGAHSAALLAADPRYLKNNAASDVHISALIGLSGPYDLPLNHERVRDKFTQVKGDEANAIALAHENMPATLLIHGESDSVAEPEHAHKFKAQLQQLEVPVTLHTYSRRRHVDLIASLASPLRFWTPAYNDIQQFLQEHGLNGDCH